MWQAAACKRLNGLRGGKKNKSALCNSGRDFLFFIRQKMHISPHSPQVPPILAEYLAFVNYLYCWLLRNANSFTPRSSFLFFSGFLCQKIAVTETLLVPNLKKNDLNLINRCTFGLMWNSHWMFVCFILVVFLLKPLNMSSITEIWIAFFFLCQTSFCFVRMSRWNSYCITVSNNYFTNKCWSWLPGNPLTNDHSETTTAHTKKNPQNAASTKKHGYQAQDATTSETQVLPFSLEKCSL